MKRRLSSVSRSAAGMALALGMIGIVADREARGEPAHGPTDAPVVQTAAALLHERCIACHGPDTRESGLRLDSRAGILRGGEFGPAAVPGNAAGSELIRRVTTTNRRQSMPPDGPRLGPEELATIAAWIDAGLPWPGRDTEPADGSAPDSRLDHRAWRPLASPPVPAAVGTRPHVEPAANEIDLFIRAALADRGLEPSPAADRRTLIRRLSFDLIGLPPTPADVDRFVADPDPRAYDALVDRLLASPRYGERWARHWLDLVHYGDTHGYDKDKPRPHAWPYRDYVIRSLNADKPYARFVREQIAGDVLWPDTLDGQEAIGFLAAGPWDFIGHVEVPETKTDGMIARHLDRDDMVATTIGTFASVTVHCAQCHAHKFDPISQDDYYALQAVFAALDRDDREYHPEAAVREAHAAVARRKAALEARRRELEAAGADDLALVMSALAALEEERKGLPPLRKAYAATAAKRGGIPRAIHVLSRGDVRAPAHEVGPGTLSLVAALESRFDLPADHSEGDRRVALADWLTDPRNPLPWRSIVNRVWQHHFGRGIVATPGDVGLGGSPPTHPELLDWLAAGFRDGGGSLKALHRLIVTSATYRQASATDAAAAAIDADDEWLWRQRRRKLEAEAVRDAVLAAAGTLDLTTGGPGWQDFTIEHPEHSPHYRYDLADPDDTATWRRSVYRFVVRSQTHPFMTVLDCADPSMRVDQRTQSISPLQALTLLNNGFMTAQARHFARRVEREAGGDPAAQIDLAMRLALGRPPTPGERGPLVALTEAHGLANACRAILNLNEFSFID